MTKAVQFNRKIDLGGFLPRERYAKTWEEKEMRERMTKKFLHWILICMMVVSLIMENGMAVCAAGTSTKESSKIATYTANSDGEDDEEEGDDEDDDEDEDGEGDDDEEDDDEDDEPKEPVKVAYVRVGAVEYNTNHGTKPKYSAKVAEGGATVAFEGWEASDGTKSYSTPAAYRDDDQIFDTFKQDVEYSYCIRIAAKKGYIFGGSLKVQVNEKTFIGETNSAHTMITLHNIYSKKSICQHVYTKKVKKATCLEDGYTTYTCKYCGNTYTTDYVKSAGQHQWELDDEESELASDEDNGELSYVCALCREERTEKVPKISKVTLSHTKYTYDGKEKKPGVKVVDSKGDTIAASYYDVSYSDNKNAGTATVTLEFKGKYDAEIEEEFTIAKASQSISAKVSSKSYKKATVAKKAQSFSIGASAKTSLTYKSSSKYVAVTSNGKVTVKKGAPKGTYKVMVSAKKSANYNSATKTLTVKVV